MNIVGKIATGTVLVVAGVGLASAASAYAPSLMPWGDQSSSENSLVITAIERTEEVSLLSVGIEGIEEERRSKELLGVVIPGSEKSKFIKYSFTLKLGLDGGDVTIDETGENEYTLTIPEFIVIGNSEPHFETATESNGLLSWATADIDELDTVNEVLNAKEFDEAIESNQDVLQDQTQFFYGNIIRAIDPTIEVEFVFAE
ncbi:hypothetical protein QQX09_08050 [Demequina sp. SYSU T00192]|uniref:DUF4230 domain-containing protein n=1 Tax=Demequina litoralis TaxID=3051660 RepID=A0ABT8G9Y1_9MICO|nr:hypothetical protein [Demequina sp. SYSU T00192]MDN4475807.1 hypothetical protein [Demequina sp. SYSU T00192]